MNENMIYVYGVAAFCLAFVVFVLIRYLWESGEEKLNTRLKNGNKEEERLLVRRQEPTDWAGRTDQAFDNLIMQTGLDLKPNQAVAWMILVGAVVGVAAWLFRGDFWLAALGFCAGAAAVMVSFFYYHSQHRNMLQDQLPDSIYLLARSLRSGMSLEQAIELMGNDGIQPIASEFKRCHAQIRLGLSITLALENMAQRMRMIDFNALVSTVSIFQIAGGNLPLLLDRLASSARDRSNMRIYFRTSTALARISIIPVALAVPVIVIAYVMWEPEYVQAFINSTNGRILLVVAVLAELGGLYWIYRLLRFDY